MIYRDMIKLKLSRILFEGIESIEEPLDFGPEVEDIPWEPPKASLTSPVEELLKSFYAKKSGNVKVPPLSAWNFYGSKIFDVATGKPLDDKIYKKKLMELTLKIVNSIKDKIKSSIDNEKKLEDYMKDFITTYTGRQASKTGSDIIDLRMIESGMPHLLFLEFWKWLSYMFYIFYIENQESRVSSIVSSQRHSVNSEIEILKARLVDLPKTTSIYKDIKSKIEKLENTAKSKPTIERLAGMNVDLHHPEFVKFIVMPIATEPLSKETEFSHLLGMFERIMTKIQDKRKKDAERKRR